MVPLSKLDAGEVGIVQDLNGGRGVVGRLAALGFTRDAEVKMVRNSGRGPVIVTVRDTRIALGRGEAGKIHVARRRELR